MTYRTAWDRSEQSTCLFFAVLLLAGMTVAAGDRETRQLRPWTDYRTIMWIGDSAYKKADKVPLFFQRLREMGINTAMVYGDGNPRRLLENQFPYYVDNMVNRGLCLKWSSNVRDWDKFVTAWTRSGRPESAFIRDYCLDDPQWRSWARQEMQTIVRKNAPNNPVAYDIRDELSTTVSANPFDYDFSAITLNKFRAWLKTQYQDLGALNAQWETKFASWVDVKPFTTDQIKNRMASGEAVSRGAPDWQALQRLQFAPGAARQLPTRWNFSPWCDFRTYMDVSLAGALDDLCQAAHALDPHTPVGIEGTQMPHVFGGYDLWRLSKVLDWVEPYDIGNAREIFGTFMPGKPILTTVFENDTNHARRRLWHLLLEGYRGCIIWWSEDCIDWKSDEYALTPKARALAPVLKEMASPIARLFLRAEKQYDPIAIHYSQPSIQVDWLLESTIDGSTWHRRFSSFEADHNRMAKVRNAWLKAFQDLGYSPRFVSTEQIEKGEASSCSVLVLPCSYALSGIEVTKLETFLARHQETSPRVLFIDGAAGLFDEHGRLRAKSPFADAMEPDNEEQGCFVLNGMKKLVASCKTGDIALYSKQRLLAAPDCSWARWIESGTKMQGRSVAVGKTVTIPLKARTRVHRYRLGPDRFLAFERNVDYHMSEELKQAGCNEALERSIELEARLDQAAHVYDLRAEKYLGRTDRLRFTLDPWQPSLFALLSEQCPAGGIIQYLSAKQTY